MVYFPIKVLSILIIVLKKFLIKICLISQTFLIYLTLALRYDYSLQIVILPFNMTCNYFVKSGYDMP